MMLGPTQKRRAEVGVRRVGCFHALVITLTTLVAIGVGAPAAWADGGDSLTETEGASIGSAAQPVEVATESGFSPISDDIDWGDGHHSAGTIQMQGELTWHIYGYHNYEEESPAGFFGDAEITVNHLPSPEKLVTTYLAPPPPRPGRPSHLLVIRRRGRLVVSWGRTTDTSTYIVAISATDRLKTSYLLRHRHVNVPGFATAGATVRVTALDAAGLPGSAMTARLAKVAAPARVSRLRLRRRRGRLLVSWLGAARAVSYRVRLVLGNRQPVMLATSRHSLSLKPANIGFAVSVTVVSDGAQGALGPIARARLDRHHP